MHKRGLLYSKAVSLIIIIIAATFYVSFLAVDVRALNACCEKTIAGDYCQYTDEANCDQSVRKNNAIASCEQTSYCQVGCCYGLGSGCFKSTSKASCEVKGRTFSTDASCSSINECKQICCQLGNEFQLTTQEACNNLADSLGIDPVIKDASTEQQCLSYGKLEETGCCTTAGSCSYSKYSECQQLSGSFNPGQYCSTLASCSNCKKQSYKSCVDGEDDVYWFDSCGNREEIAQDCDYLSGTICGDVSGSIQCKSVDCQETYDSPVIDYDGGPRKNGESWCEYEGSTGGGTDLVGSRHYRRSCVNGEEIVEPCADYRQEYCTQGTLELNGERFTEAFCVPNKGDGCVSECNSGNLGDDKKCCSNNPSCFWTGASCLPVVPEGSKFWEGQNANVCAQADQDFIVYWSKATGLSDWKCAGNCQVINDNNFAEKFDSYCVAQGDCGAYYNYIGAFTQDGYTCSRSDGSCRGTIHGSRFNLAGIDSTFFGGFEKLRKATGLEFEKLVINDIKIKLPVAINIIGAKILSTLFRTDVSSLDEYLISKYGTYIGAALAVATYGVFAHFTTVAWQFGAVPGVGWALLVATIVVLILSLTGKKDDATFSLSCEPWQSPSGGKDCTKCDADSLHPCTEYKCKSLGQNCEYIAENEGTSRPKCYNVNPNDINSPILSPLVPGYSVREEINGYVVTQPVPANKRFNFGVKANELSQCRFSDEPITQDDTDYFGGSFYSLNHNITISPLSGVDYKYYLRCKDKSGNENQKDYVINFETDKGPDLTPPFIEYTSPRNNGFVMHGLANITSNLFVNEAADCRYSSTDKAYESMTGNFNCLVSQDPNSALYRCESSLIFKEPSSTYYIRCKDNSTNINTQSYIYTLKGTNELVITSKKPEGKIVANSQTLELTTAGGAESGRSYCRFAPEDLPYSAMIDFFATNSSQHTQMLALDAGTYNYYVKCRDLADNEAKAKLAFTVEIDNKPPRITRLYKDASSINMILSEPAICEYSTKQFTFGSGTNMPEDNSITHSAPLLSGYYVECRDPSGNSLGMVRIFP